MPEVDYLRVTPANDPPGVLLFAKAYSPSVCKYWERNKLGQIVANSGGRE